MNVVIGMECSGTIRDAFRRLGHEAVSIDLKPDANNSPHHIQGDVFDVLKDTAGEYDLGIFHPDCTYLSVSGYHWCYKDPTKYPNTVCGPARLKMVDQAIADFIRVASLPIPRVCVENPTNIMSTRWRKYDQMVQPYEFGDDASKRTCFWLTNLPKLVLDPSQRLPGRMVTNPENGKIVERWGNQTDSGQNRLGPSVERAAIRAQTYPGIADAIASQWGLLTTQRKFFSFPLVVNSIKSAAFLSIKER